MEIQLFEVWSWGIFLWLKGCAWSSSMTEPLHIIYSLLVTYINLTFPEPWIGLGGHVQWPPRSPDLTPLDFCLWGWIKSEVYKEIVNTRDELVACILPETPCIMFSSCRSHWPHYLRSRSTSARFLEFWVRTLRGAWMPVCLERCVLGRGLRAALITRPADCGASLCVI